MNELIIKWERIVVDKNPVVRFINLGNGTQFKLISFFHHSKLFVALERLGAFFFDGERFKSGEYVSEKLNICIADADIIADWINCQIDKYQKQQGHYSLDYLNDVDNYYNPISPIVLTI